MKKAPADGPGIEGKTKHPSISVQPAQGQRPVDIRASLLLRAAARYDLLHHGVIGLDEAFDNQFISDLLEATGACPCHSGTLEYFDRAHREDRERRLTQWRKQQERTND